MIYSYLSKTGFNISKIVLGSEFFGTEITEKDTFSIIDAYTEAGGNLIDTASMYGDWLTDEKSMSEKTIGKWLKSRNCREKVFIATKGGHPQLDTLEISRMSDKELRFDFENSLKNLDTDYVDIYYFHKDDPQIPPEELIGISNSVTGDKVRCLGVSNWTVDRICRANEYATKHGLRPIVASQISHSIAKINPDAHTFGIHVMEEMEYDIYKTLDMGVFAYSAQAKGFFSKIDSGGKENLSDYMIKTYYNTYNMELFNKLSAFSKEKDVPVSAVILALLISDTKLNLYAQIGVRNVARLEEAFKAADIVFTEEELRYLLEK